MECACFEKFKSQLIQKWTSAQKSKKRLPSIFYVLLMPQRFRLAFTAVSLNFQWDTKNGFQKKKFKIWTKKKLYLQNDENHKTLI